MQWESLKKSNGITRVYGHPCRSRNATSLQRTASFEIAARFRGNDRGTRDPRAEFLAHVQLALRASIFRFLIAFDILELSRATGYIPLRMSARALLRKEGFYEKHPAFETAILQMEYAREAPNLKHWSASWKIIEEAMTSVVGDDAPAFGTLKAAEVKTGTLLKSGVVPDR